MKTINYLTIIFLALVVISCGSNSGLKKNDFSIETNAEKGNISIDETLTLAIKNKKNIP